MPLVVITGQPCSGKSTVAAQLMQVLQARGIDTCNLVDEPSLHLFRNTAYKDVPSEKNTRALLKSTVERYIGRKEITILDSINNIKVCCSRMVAFNTLENIKSSFLVNVCCPAFLLFMKKFPTASDTCSRALHLLLQGFRYELWCIAKAAGTRYCM
eukprot:scaffold35795_cov18-Tisochrysis_lutea.AAC.1